MAHDTTPPRTRVIVFFTLLFIAVLVVLQIVLVSYFDAMAQKENQAKVAGAPAGFSGGVEWMSDIRTVTAQDLARLENIGRSMERVAADKRDPNAVPEIKPEPSTNMAARAGWMHHPNYVPAEAPDVQPLPVIPAELGGEGVDGDTAEDPEAAPAAQGSVGE